MRLVILNIFLFIAFSAICQDADYARKVIKDLCAVEMYGRGYVKNGDHQGPGDRQGLGSAPGCQGLPDQARQRSSADQPGARSAGRRDARSGLIARTPITTWSRR